MMEGACGGEADDGPIRRKASEAQGASEADVEEGQTLSSIPTAASATKMRRRGGARLPGLPRGQSKGGSRKKKGHVKLRDEEEEASEGEGERALPAQAEAVSSEDEREGGNAPSQEEERPVDEEDVTVPAPAPVPVAKESPMTAEKGQARAEAAKQMTHFDLD